MMARDEALARTLPAIGEDARALPPSPPPAASAPALASPTDRWSPLAPSLSPSSSRASSRASSVASSSPSRRAYSASAGLHSGACHLPRRLATSPSAVRPLRRRFLSQDVVTKPLAADAPRFLGPLTRLHASSSSSSLALRRWVSAKASAVRGGFSRSLSLSLSLSLSRYPSAADDGSPTADPWADTVDYEAERPRTRSETFLHHAKRASSPLYSVNLLPEDGGVHTEEEEEEDDEEEGAGDSGRDDSDGSSEASSMSDVDEEEEQEEEEEAAWDGASAETASAAEQARLEEERGKREKLHNLQRLLQEGFITVTEYKDRHVQLVGEPTAVTEPTIAKATDLLALQLPIIYHAPPDFSQIRARDAIKHVFDSVNCKWTSSRIQVKIDSQPFARGGLRQVFHLQDLSAGTSNSGGGASGPPYDSYVAKVAINPDEDPDTYFRDVEMQAVAAKFATLYNSYNPPRRVEFLEAWILQLVPSTTRKKAARRGSSIHNSSDKEDDEDNDEEDDDDASEDASLRGMICGVEPFIAGEYHKHNNNFGYVSELERNTPQAFSHFTFEASGEQILVVDIQGVGDHYTDPQIHTRRGQEFGKGNLAVRGFQRFLESHRCNPICRYLKLPLTNPKDDDDDPLRAGNADPKGTVPAQTYMSQPRVDTVDSVLCHYYADSKAFQRYRAAASTQGHLQEGEGGQDGGMDATDKDLDWPRRRRSRDMRLDQRSCSLFFCGAGQQCVIS